MKNLKNLMEDVLHSGEYRNTRTGEVLSKWKANLEFDLGKGFPAVTSKKLPWRVVVGELLWFLSKSKHISDLKRYTFGEDVDKWTIWTDDAKRWNNETSNDDMGFVGDLYPTQWRNFNNQGVDQIQTLIDNLKRNPKERNHIVMAWNPVAISNNSMALKPCHIGFQCYVTNDGKLNLHWWQRSWDLFLGAPANIASYALLTHMLAKICDLEAGTLSVDVGDAHIYKNHIEQVNEYLSNEEFELPNLIIPNENTIDGFLQHTALDFRLENYISCPAIKAPLSVG
jgi:thymidylate synthase